jgi:hypothetical protein
VCAIYHPRPSEVTSEMWRHSRPFPEGISGYGRLYTRGRVGLVQNRGTVASKTLSPCMFSAITPFKLNQSSRNSVYDYIFRFVTYFVNFFNRYQSLRYALKISFYSKCHIFQMYELINSMRKLATPSHYRFERATWELSNPLLEKHKSSFLTLLW